MENLIAHAILTIVMLLGPRVKPGGDSLYGPNERWNIFRVYIKAPGHTSMKEQYWPGVLKQALTEWRAHWLFPLLVTAYPAWIAASPLLGNAIGFVGTFVGFAFLKKTTDGLDALGTNVEIIAAERAGFDDYREQEAKRYAGKTGSVEAAKRSLTLALPLAYLIYPLSYRVPFMEGDLKDDTGAQT